MAADRFFYQAFCEVKQSLQSILGKPKAERAMEELERFLSLRPNVYTNTFPQSFVCHNPQPKHTKEIAYMKTEELEETTKQWDCK